MSKTYSYGPLKSSYFTQYEKIWIEGFCKERKMELSESNLCSTLYLLTNFCAYSLKTKVVNLMQESEKFSTYSKDLFIKSWNNILGYSMGVVQPQGTINENQIESMKKTSKWWLTEAPKLISSEMKHAYFTGLVLECVSVNENVLSELKAFNPCKKTSLIETAKGQFSYDKITMPCPPCRIPTKDIFENEPVLNMIPNADKIIAMAAWTAETVKLITK